MTLFQEIIQDAIAVGAVGYFVLAYWAIAKKKTVKEVVADLREYLRPKEEENG